MALETGKANWTLSWNSVIPTFDEAVARFGGSSKAGFAVEVGCADCHDTPDRYPRELPGAELRRLPQVAVRDKAGEP